MLHIVAIFVQIFHRKVLFLDDLYKVGGSSNAILAGNVVKMFVAQMSWYRTIPSQYVSTHSEFLVTQNSDSEIGSCLPPLLPDALHSCFASPALPIPGEKATSRNVLWSFA